MASPLSPACEASLNRASPPSKRKYEDYEVRAYTTECSGPGRTPDDTQSSSPFVSHVTDTIPSAPADQENASPRKPRHSRVISGAELSPLKILSGGASHAGEPMGPPPPRKVSPVNRFPVKVNPRKMEMDEAMRDNDGLKHAIDIFEDEKSIASAEGDGDAAGPDDTMASTFSTFSVVPNMTVFAKLGQSPTKDGERFSQASPPGSAAGSNNTSNLLMEFTDQMRFPYKTSPGKKCSLSPSRTMPNVASAATPSRRQSNLTNLIDFDIPPQPTPRSVPSITPRELESLKSGFLSQISSLKASLSGKEAEVHSLKAAVGDAEKRVGESMEQLREEKAIKDQLAAEREDWEARGHEMESMLCKVREEMMENHQELEQKLEESEKRREAAEMLHQEAESKMAGMRAGKESDTSPGKSSSATASASQNDNTNREVEIAVERVARELHTLYKGKHETKVAALKKSYEARWEKKVKELEGQVAELRRDKDKLQAGRDARAEMDTTIADADMEERRVQAVKDSASIKELNADVHRLEAVVSTVQRDNKDLRTLLERERVEKGELVQLAEEMMSMQSFVGKPQQQKQSVVQQQQQQQPRQTEAKTPRASADGGTRSGIARRGSSGLRAPGSGIRTSFHERSRSGGSGGLPRPGRSGIMNSIEKMGSYRGRGEQ